MVTSSDLRFKIAKQYISLLFTCTDIVNLRTKSTGRIDPATATLPRWYARQKAKLVFGSSRHADS